MFTMCMVVMSAAIVASFPQKGPYFGTSHRDDVGSLRSGDGLQNLDQTSGGVREVVITSGSQVPGEFREIFNRIGRDYRVDFADPKLKWVFRFWNTSGGSGAEGPFWKSSWRASWVQDSFGKSSQDDIASLKTGQGLQNVDTSTSGKREVVLTTGTQIPREFQDIFNRLAREFNLNFTDPNTKWVFRFTNSTGLDAPGSTYWKSSWRASWVNNPGNFSITYVE